MSNEIAVRDLDLEVQGVMVNGPSLDIGDISEEQFEVLGWKLKAVNGFTQFWIGDWANAGLIQHGKGTMTAIARKLGYTPGTVWNLASIARRYDSSGRGEVLSQYPQLSYTHFEEAVTAPNPIAVLEMAGEEEWSTRDVQSYVRDKYSKPSLEPKPAAILDPLHVGHDAIADLRKASYTVLASDKSLGDKEAIHLSWWAVLSQTITEWDKNSNIDLGKGMDNE